MVSSIRTLIVCSCGLSGNQRRDRHPIPHVANGLRQLIAEANDELMHLLWCQIDPENPCKGLPVASEAEPALLGTDDPHVRRHISITPCPLERPSCGPGSVVGFGAVVLCIGRID